MADRTSKQGLEIDEPMGWTRRPRKRPFEVVDLSLGPGQPRRYRTLIYVQQIIVEKLNEHRTWQLLRS